MERNKITLSNREWCDLVTEESLSINNIEIPIQIEENIYTGTGRHTESHIMIFQTLSDGKFYSIGYETSVKDSMGWDECNYGIGMAKEVFPREVTSFVYE